MRMSKIPRSLPNEPSVAEQIELGSGMIDSRAHVGPTPNAQVVNPQEREHFQNLEKIDADPRMRPSAYHDPVNITPDSKVKTSITEEEVIDGYVEDVIMYPEGAHLKIVNDQNTCFIFDSSTSVVFKDARVRVVDRVITKSFDYETHPGSGENYVETEHQIIVLDVDDEQVDNHAIETEE